MKNLLFFLLITINLNGFSQTQMSTETRHSFQQIVTITKDALIDKELVVNKLYKYPIYLVNGEYCISTVAIIEKDFQEKDRNPLFYIGSRVGDIVTIKIPLKNLKNELYFDRVRYIEIAERIQPLNFKMSADVRADSVWEGINLPKGYTGKGVLIGVSDWGFDYNHPMFMDTTLSFSRIRAAWDQFKIQGTPPVGMGYGAEYLSPIAIADANSDTAGAYYDYATHGSHVAGIAGGSGAGLKYRGVAFEAEYLFNSQQLDIGAAIDAFSWMKSIADLDGKRLVVNMSWGLYYIGPMDGTSLLSQAINTLSDQGIVFVNSAGNNGLESFHIKKTYANDSIRSRITFYSYSAHPQMWGQCVSMWGEPSKPFSAMLEVYNSANNLVGTSQIFNTDLHAGYFDSILVIGIDTVFYNFAIDSSFFQNMRPHMTLRVKNTNTTLKIILNSFAPTGTVHYWNLVELSNGVGNWGLDFVGFGNNAVNGDSDNGIGEPACTEKLITVAAHVSESYSLQGQVFLGARAGFSSIGPTYDGRMKPDISAPGNNVISSINSYTTASYTSVASVQFNGRTYHFAAMSGTSMSSPALAGVAALVLEANPFLSASQVKNILKTTARQDAKTGIITPPGSPLWGMGKVTATDAILLALNTLKVETSKESSSISIYPNPACEKINIELQSVLSEKIYFEIYNVQGQLITKGDFLNSISIDVENLLNGIYIIKIRDFSKSYSFKFVKN